MKKFLLLSILSLFSVVTPSFAQNNPAQCNLIYSSNYASCCQSTAGAVVNKTQCDAYTRGIRTTTVPGTIGGGTVSTSPFNGGAAAGTGGSAVSPQSSSRALSECSTITFKSLLDILIWLKCIIVVAIIPLIFVLAFLFFLWGILRFMQASDSTAKEDAKKYILWGLIALFVMTGVWGIIKIVSTTLGVESGMPMLQTKYLNH